MKKSILLTAFLIFIFIVLIVLDIYFWQAVNSYIQTIQTLKGFNDIQYQEAISDYQQGLNKLAIYGSITTIASLANLTAIMLIATKYLPIFKTISNKLAAHKEQRAQAKAERAEADKQARIAELEKQLEELKKDE